MPRRRALGQAFRERLAESTPSAKLMVRGRASRSRHESDVTTIKSIAIRTHTKQCAGIPTCTSVYQSIRPYLLVA